MTQTEIKQVLAELGTKPNKALGQNFLTDENILRLIVEAAAISEGDLVLEVGPGLGVLTRKLLQQGAEVVVIERDRRFVEYLKESIGENGRMKIVQGDAADVHWHELIGEGNWKFVSNLPYSITSFALRKALWAPKPPENLVVLVQREVGERATEAADGISKKRKTSLLSLMVALSAESSRIVRRVSAGCFFPPPKVESVILQVTPMPWAEREKKWGINPEKIMETAKRGFAHPRKLLKSNLAQAGVDAESYLCELGINEKARAEDLSPEDWARLTQKLKTNGA